MLFRSNELKGKDTKEFYDAQSNAVKSDAFNWSSTLNAALEKTDDQLSFVVSAGDQIQTTKKKSPNKDASKSEIEYTGYLSPEALKSLPVATTVGNHDADNANYTYHFNRTNASELGSNKVVGGNYYFKYGNALFIMLNTQDTNVAEHKQFIEQTVAANKDCKWRIVTLHQDIYGSAEHSNEPEITNLRYQLTPIFEQNDIDAVLTGHDHAYSRSKMLLGGTKANDYIDDEFDAELEKDMDAGENPTTKTVAPGNIKNDSTDEKDQKYLTYLKSIMDEKAIETVKKQGSSVINPEGVLYMTAGSSSGSKYYDLVPRQQTYIAHRWQEDVPTYSVVDVTENSLTINTYRTDNDEKIDETFSITKSKGFNLQLSVIILLIFHNCLYIIIIYIDRGKYTSFHREHTTYSGVKKATAPIKHKKKFRPCKPAGLQGRNLYTAAVSSTASRLSQFSRMQRQVNAFASSAFSEKISVCISFTRALSPK